MKLSDVVTLAVLALVVGGIIFGKRKGQAQRAAALAAAFNEGHASGYAASRADAAATSTSGVVNILGAGNDSDALAAIARQVATYIAAADNPTDHNPAIEYDHDHASARLQNRRTLRYGRVDDDDGVRAVQDTTRRVAIPARVNGAAVAAGRLRGGRRDGESPESPEVVDL